MFQSKTILLALASVSVSAQSACEVAGATALTTLETECEASVTNFDDVLAGKFEVLSKVCSAKCAAAVDTYQASVSTACAGASNNVTQNAAIIQIVEAAGCVKADSGTGFCVETEFKAISASGLDLSKADISAVIPLLASKPEIFCTKCAKEQVAAVKALKISDTAVATQTKSVTQVLDSLCVNYKGADTTDKSGAGAQGGIGAAAMALLLSFAL